jgi:hypothetical protein
VSSVVALGAWLTTTTITLAAAHRAAGAPRGHSH